ncbi:wax ester/triacylglycerol synthase family O-acyltransferase [Hoyosella sp. G463]|uniref:Diacylglycerol O-acyltransferase n=1 Tax=Lolliginicoccus lacisalsi TaxID=2742202 RepID=A0A927PJS3_9ACTN|nr:wax ester/triacylglycerol synthase family O-acyltransferase [Lolliginicoccus lacisalsi]MBD8504873.1 wax ester/triacylglycerol synthase family O-acyltransferase [Lolliginicoccus lacisalsi]
MRLISPLDYLFLALEAREHPMHVGGLELFRPPDGDGHGFARQLHVSLVRAPEIATTFTRHPGAAGASPRMLTWAVDTEIDLDYHVRLGALPRPGRIRELLEMTSMWHSTLLDRHRPLWEMHIVEGLEDGRVAVYTKIHHALVDGVSALRLLQDSLSSDPDERQLPAPFAPRPPTGHANYSAPSMPLLRSALGLGGDVAGMLPATARLGWRVARKRGMPLPMTAPRTIFNVPIGGARRFAAQSWSIDRIRSVREALGCTINDVVLGMCGGALRRYLIEQDALPDAPLIALVPVSLHSLTGTRSGNAVTAVLASLGTDHADPLDRMAAITLSIGKAKEMMAGLTPTQAIAVAASFLSPFVASSVSGFSQHAWPTFNVVISNVPGPRAPLYLNGARLEGIYPASIVMDGLALNITLTSNADTLDFGLTGCRRSVPHLQRLLAHLDASLEELEHASGCVIAERG